MGVAAPTRGDGRGEGRADAGAESDLRECAGGGAVVEAVDVVERVVEEVEGGQHTGQH